MTSFMDDPLPVWPEFLKEKMIPVIITIEDGIQDAATRVLVHSRMKDLSPVLIAMHRTMLKKASITHVSPVEIFLNHLSKVWDISNPVNK